MVSPGENVLVITRRLFESDVRRHFIGRVVKANSIAMRIEGYVFTYDETAHEFVRLDEIRTRIVSFADSGMIVLILQSKIDLRHLHYHSGRDRKRYLTDDKDFRMNIPEFSTFR